MTDLLICVVLFLILLFCGIPITFSLAIPTLVWILMNPSVSLGVLSQKMATAELRFTLISMPCFLVAGRIMNYSGVTDRLMNLAVAIVGRFKGGLALANALASMMFATMSGNAVTDAAGLGLIEMKMMKDAGYDPDVAAGITAASSCLGPIIPPSSNMVLLGSITGLSVSSMFIAGIIPGVLMTCSLMTLIVVRAHLPNTKKHWPKTVIPAKQAIKAIIRGLPALGCFVIIIGSILTGICTPSEAAVLAVWWSIFLGICYKKITLKLLWDTLTDAIRSAGSFMLLMAVASFLSWIVTIEGIPQILARALPALAGGSNAVILFICMCIFLFVGCFIDTPSATLLLAPIMLPCCTAMGVPEIQFAMVMVCSLVIGIITPPFGICLFVTSDVGNVPVKDVTKEALKYLPAMIITVLLVVFIPQVSLWLPELMLK